MDSQPIERFQISKPLEELPPGDSFLMNYQATRIDRNALFALGQVFDREKIAMVREKYKRAFLNIDDLRDNLKKFSCPKYGRSHTDAYWMAIYSVANELKPKDKIIPLTTGAVVNSPSYSGNKSPGIPEKMEGYKTKREATDDPRILQRIRQIWYDIEAGRKVELPDVACYARAQICKRDTNKVRPTWGYPLTVYLQEAAYFYPILDHLKSLESPLIAYGMEIGNGGMDMIHSAVNQFEGSNKIIGDWSAFDSTLPPWLLRDAFNILKEWIDWDHVMDSTGKVWPVRGHRSRRRWRQIVDYFINTPIRLSDGTRYLKRGGLPSGSCFTNVIGSIVNAIVMRYLTYDITGEFPLFDVYLGDDSLVVTRKPINLEYFAQLAHEQFSMNFNVDKSYQTCNIENIHFLGYYNISGYPYKPIDGIIVSSIYPERVVRSKFETITRLVGQAYSCFESTDATKFFRAAKILADEEGIDKTFIEEFIHRNPHQFKYLQTVGVDPKNISFPDVGHDGICFITIPNAPRKRVTIIPKYPLLIYDEMLKFYKYYQIREEQQIISDEKELRAEIDVSNEKVVTR